ncbi:MAG: TlpA family protein disulfide reductase [Bacteriovoracia bacterium]
MVWKKKERELTPEEAIALAKQELKPFWFGVTPLFAAIRQPDAVTIHPLDPQFSSHTWILYFLDQNSFHYGNALKLAAEWQKRYAPYSVRSLIVMHSDYPQQADAAAMEKFIEKTHLKFPVVLSQGGLVPSAYQVKSFPTVTCIHQGRVFHSMSGNRWFDTVETVLQDHLRKSDPGLPLAMPLQSRELPAIAEISRALGKKAATNLVFKPSRNGASAPSDEKILLIGQWTQTDDCVTTSDPEAQIRFRTRLPRVSIVAASLSKTVESAKILVESDGAPALDIFSGTDLKFEDDGQSFLEIKDLQLYQALEKLTPDKFEITLKFSHAKRVPVAVHGIRTCEIN